MIEQLRALAARLDRLEASLQRPTQELRDAGDLRLRIGRQPDDAWTVRAHDPAGAVVADLLGLGPISTTLPPSPLPGQVVRYRHTTGQVPWLCIWDPALNSGAGAWSVLGGPPVEAVASGGTSTTVTGSYTQTAVSGTPAVTVPAPGLYTIEMRLPIQVQSGGLLDLFVGVRRGASALVAWVDYFVTTAAWQGSSVVGSTHAVALPTTGEAITMVAAGGTASTWSHSSSLGRLLRLHPQELRP